MRCRRQEAWASLAHPSEMTGRDQWIEILFGGQYVKKTSPISSFLGTVPQTRESHDAARLSPIMKYRSGRILIGAFVS